MIQKFLSTCKNTKIFLVVSMHLQEGTTDVGSGPSVLLDKHVPILSCWQKREFSMVDIPNKVIDGLLQVLENTWIVIADRSFCCFPRVKNGD
jgi:hypothetical protein